MSDTLVIGFGQRFRGDDGVGPFVVEALKETHDGEVEFQECQGDAFELMERWNGREQVYVIDAVDPNEGEPGTIHRLDGLNDRLPVQTKQSSSHVLGLNEALELGRVLGKMPRKLTIYGVTGTSFDHGQALSPAVDEAARILVREISAALKEES